MFVKNAITENVASCSLTSSRTTSFSCQWHPLIVIQLRKPQCHLQSFIFQAIKRFYHLPEAAKLLNLNFATFNCGFG